MTNLPRHPDKQGEGDDVQALVHAFAPCRLRQRLRGGPEGLIYLHIGADWYTESQTKETPPCPPRRPFPLARRHTRF